MYSISKLDTCSMPTFSYERVTSLKFINPKLKVLLGLNGWNTRFYPTHSLGMVASPSFVQYTIDFLRQRDFDGIDIDWEYSSRRRGLPTSKDGFTELLRVIKQIRILRFYHLSARRGDIDFWDTYIKCKM